MPNVNHEILVWAREAANLTREQAVNELGIGDPTSTVAVQQLVALECGKSEPTRLMLVKMAKHYRRPLLTFYLSAPPREEERGTDFRALPPSLEHAADSEALLDALLRNVRARQSMVRAVLVDEQPERVSFIGTRTMSEGKDVLLSSLHELLGFDWSKYCTKNTAEDAFSLLRTSAEKAGVFVLLQGDLGSRQTVFDVEVFRGFAIADEVAPFVVINDRDAKPAWSFTLLHEMVHLLLGQTGISGARTDSEIEKFCSDVAIEFLFPLPVLGDLLHCDLPEKDLHAAMTRIAEFAGVRYLSPRRVDYAKFVSRAIAMRTRCNPDGVADHDRQADEQKPGASDYAVRRHRIGNKLLNLTQHMMEAEALSTSKAAKILGVNPKDVQALLRSGGPS